MARSEKTSKLVLTALMLCLVLLATFSIKIPAPFTQGYVHLGDTFIFVSVLLLGKKHGAIAAGFGSAMADVLGGFAMYAPWTLIIKFAMAFVMGLFVEISLKTKKKFSKVAGVPVVQIVGMVIAGVIMVAGYCFVDGLFAGNLLAGALGIPFNTIQFVVGIALALIIIATLYKTPAKKMFEYRIDELK
ncbi:MAG: ECF transporter S component [Firmicutes bacterium]|nr:ECF transporter S component [Bacillota bacterium]